MNTNIASSFRPKGQELFLATTLNAGDASPPYVIAQIAQDRVEEGDLSLPLGYNEESLGTLCIMFGAVGLERLVSFRQGIELRHLGRQILALEQEGKVLPPLDPYEKASIERLVTVVSASEAVLSHKR